MGKTLELSGLEAVLKAFRALPKKLKAAQKRAARLAVSPLNKAAKANAPKPGKKAHVQHKGQTVRFLVQGSTGALRKSIGSKVGVGKSGVVFGLVGSRKELVLTAWNPWIKKTVKVKPARYAHLVEKGFSLTIGGRKRRVRGRAFLQPAFDSKRREMSAIVESTLRAELSKATVAQMGAV